MGGRTLFAQGFGFTPIMTEPKILPTRCGWPVMIRSLTLALALSWMAPTFAQDNKPSQAPSQNAQSEGACRSKCDAQYNQNKECQEGVAPMHSACELFNQCLNDCD
jgi:hypothetical protein